MPDSEKPWGTPKTRVTPLTREEFERLVKAPRPRPQRSVLVLPVAFVAAARRLWPEMFR